MKASGGIEKSRMEACGREGKERRGRRKGEEGGKERKGGEGGNWRDTKGEEARRGE